jgi:hypothetical protein
MIIDSVKVDSDSVLGSLINTRKFRLPLTQHGLVVPPLCENVLRSSKKAISYARLINIAQNIINDIVWNNNTYLHKYIMDRAKSIIKNEDILFAMVIFAFDVQIDPLWIKNEEFGEYIKDIHKIPGQIKEKFVIATSIDEVWKLINKQEMHNRW